VGLFREVRDRLSRKEGLRETILSACVPTMTTTADPLISHTFRQLFRADAVIHRFLTSDSSIKRFPGDKLTCRLFQLYFLKFTFLGVSAYNLHFFPCPPETPGPLSSVFDRLLTQIPSLGASGWWRSQRFFWRLRLPLPCALPCFARSCPLALVSFDCPGSVYSNHPCCGYFVSAPSR